MNILEDMRNQDRYDEQILEDVSIYWRAELCKMTDIIDYLVVMALMRLDISTEQWLGEV